MDISGPDHVSSAQGQHGRHEEKAQGLSTHRARLEPLLPNQICDEVRFCRLDNNVQCGHQENHSEHRVARETIARSRSTRPNRGRAQVRTSTAHGHETRAFRVSGRSAEDVKIMVEAFLAERGVQANSKASHNAMQSEHIQRMALAHAQRPK